MPTNPSATTHRPLPRNAMLACMGLIILAAVIFLTNFRLFVTSGPSMEPTYTEGTSVLAVRLYGSPKVGDVVFLKYNDMFCMKRVAFIAGQDVSEDGYESYWDNNIVPEGYVFVLGDNAEHSKDSRNPEFGLVAISDIWGKPVSQREKEAT